MDWTIRPLGYFLNFFEPFFGLNFGLFFKEWVGNFFQGGGLSYVFPQGGVGRFFYLGGVGRRIMSNYYV